MAFSWKRLLIRILTLGFAKMASGEIGAGRKTAAIGKAGGEVIKAAGEEGKSGGQ